MTASSISSSSRPSAGQGGPSLGKGGTPSGQGGPPLGQGRAPAKSTDPRPARAATRVPVRRRRPLAPLLALVLFAGLAFAGDRIGARVLQTVLDRSGFRYAKLYAGRAEAELLVIGDSRAVHAAFAPALAKETCRPVMNLAYNGLTTPVADTLLRDYLDRDPKPRLVLLEASMALRGDAAMLSQLKPFMGRSERLAALLRAEPGRSLIPWQEVSHLYRYNSEMFWRALSYLGRSDQGWINRGRVATPAILDAFFARRGAVAAIAPPGGGSTSSPPPAGSPPSAGAGIAGPPPSDPAPHPVGAAIAAPDGFTLDRRSVEALKATVSMLRAAGVTPLLFVAPYHPAVASRLPDARRWIAALATELGPETPLLDLTGATIPENGFADPLHMNLTGSLALLPQLVAALPALSSCPPASS